MGSSNSRLGRSKPSTSFSGHNRSKRSFLAFLFCGASLQAGEHSQESLKKSPETVSPSTNDFVSPNQYSSISFGSEAGLTSSNTENRASSGSSNGAIEDTCTICNLSNLSENIGLASQQVNANDGLMEARADQPTMDHDTRVPLSDRELIGDTSMVSSGIAHSVVSGSLITSSPLAGFLLPVGEQEPRGLSLLFFDMVSARSNILSGSIAEISNGEARRNSRRMFWNAFSRSSFRQISDSPTIVFTNSHTDDVGYHDRWLLDFSGDLHYDGVGRESRHSDGRSGHRSGQQWQTRYEMSETFHDVHDEESWQTPMCATGLHPHRTCSCESSFMAEDSSNRASISQIIMLADALFEVLEEIHRHRISLSMSMLSLPAPEAVVNSFPVKNHKRSHGTELGGHEAEQCLICLVDYEEGDKIRVLPCSHEYHMACVDKWLKEIHGVCPLCRDDVCKGAVEGLVSNTQVLIRITKSSSETTSLEEYLCYHMCQGNLQLHACLAGPEKGRWTFQLKIKSNSFFFEQRTWALHHSFEGHTKSADEAK